MAGSTGRSDDTKEMKQEERKLKNEGSKEWLISEEGRLSKEATQHGSQFGGVTSAGVDLGPVAGLQLRLFLHLRSDLCESCEGRLHIC